MRRCHLCSGWIWPWQLIRYRLAPSGLVGWHGGCFRRLVQIMEEEADVWEEKIRIGGT